MRATSLQRRETLASAVPAATPVKTVKTAPKAEPSGAPALDAAAVKRMLSRLEGGSATAGSSLIAARRAAAGDHRAPAAELGAVTLELGQALDAIAPSDKLHTTSWQAMNRAATLLSSGQSAHEAIEALSPQAEGELLPLTAAILALTSPGALEVPLVKQRKAKTAGELLASLGAPAKTVAAAKDLEIPADRWLDLREAAIRIRLGQLLCGVLEENGAIRDLKLTTSKTGVSPVLVVDLEVDPFKSGAIKQLQRLIERLSEAYGPRFDVRLDPEVAASLALRPAYESLKKLEGLRFGSITTDQNSTVYHSDQSIQTQQNLVVLDRAIEHVKKTHGEDVLQDFVVLAIPHLLKDVEAFVNAFLDSGADPADLTLLGIPYSTKYVEVPRLRRLGVTGVHTPETYDDFLARVPKILESAVARSAETGKKLLIIEDGGYFTPYLHTPECAAMLADHGFSSIDQVLQGVVEQTSNGIWRDQKIPELKTEVLSIPDLALKQQIEPPFVGTAVADNVAKLIGKLGDSVKGRDVLVLSYGNIGAEVVEAFQGKQAIVASWDLKPISRIKSRNEGHATKKDPTDLFLDAWLVVGASGVTAIDAQRLDELIEGSKHQRVYLASGSSKRIEIDVAHLAKRASEVEKLQIDGEHLGTLYRFENGREIAVLADGYPVNFFGQDAQSVPSEHIAPVLAALYLAAVQLATTEKRVHQIHAPEPWIEALVTEAYEAFLDN